METVKGIIIVTSRTTGNASILFFTSQRVIISKAGGSYKGVIGGYLLAGPIGALAVGGVAAKNAFKKIDTVSRLNIEDVLAIDKNAKKIDYSEIQSICYGKWVRSTTLKIQTTQKSYSWILSDLPKTLKTEEESKAKLKGAGITRIKEVIAESLPDKLIPA